MDVHPTIVMVSIAINTHSHWPINTWDVLQLPAPPAWRSSLGSSTEQLESENWSSSSGTSCVAFFRVWVQGPGSRRVFWEWNDWCFSGWKTNTCGILKKWGLIWGFLDQHLGGFHQHMDRRLEGNKWRGLKHEAEHHCIVFFQDNPYFWTCYGLITCARKKIRKLVFGCHRWYLPHNSQLINWFYLFGPSSDRTDAGGADGIPSVASKHLETPIWEWVKTLVPLVNPKIAGIYGCSSH